MQVQISADYFKKLKGACTATGPHGKSPGTKGRFQEITGDMYSLPFKFFCKSCFGQRVPTNSEKFKMGNDYAK